MTIDLKYSLIFVFKEHNKIETFETKKHDYFKELIYFYYQYKQLKMQKYIIFQENILMKYMKKH